MLDKPTPFDSAPSEEGVEALARRFQAIAEQHGGERFHLFRIRGQQHVLTPLLDMAIPGLSQQTLSLPATLPDDFGKRAATSMCVLWWDEMEGPLEEKLAASKWAVRLRTNQSLPGMAMPLGASDGGQGVVIFTGPRFSIDEDTMMDVHARCQALFDELPEVTPEREIASMPSMSRRELQCLKLTAGGLTSEDIAHELGLSVHTANQYLANAAQKLNATNRIHAVAKALREGLID